MGRIVLYIITFSMGVALLVLAAGKVYGHSWYDPWCCTVDDCERVPPYTVEYTGTGWRVTLQPGDHSKVKEPMTKFFPEEEARRSQDSDYHACVWPNDEWSEVPRDIRCLYVPMPGV